MEQDQTRATEPPFPSPKSTNSEHSRFTARMSRMSLGTAAATELPPSSPGMPFERRRSEINPPSPLKLRRTPSTQSLTSKSGSSTPTLLKKSSLSSLKGTGGSTPPRSPSVRRVSSNLALSSPSGMAGRTSLSTATEEPPPPPITAASVAKEFLERDIARHKETSDRPNLVVVLHDACYGHRFSRPKTSKASLNTIVERPERILATVLGVCSAYVLLGGRHAAAENAPHPHAQPGQIPFKIQKSSRFVPLVSPAVTNVHGTKWMNELKMMCEGAEAKLALNGKELVRPSTNSGEEGNEEKPRLHEGDLYLCSESLNALEGSLGGVFDAIDAVFDASGPDKAFVAIRPPGHHCSDNYPSGFCWINNVHVGISHATSVHGLTHAAIIDFDLHHGDGSQAITWAHNAKVATLPKNAAVTKKTAIGYFSLHDINSYPCEWGDEDKVRNASLCIENAHGQTIWNVHLQPWKTDADFWTLYETRYLTLLEKTRNFFKHHFERLQSSHNSPQPKAAIFISAGFDASEWEGQGMQRHKVNVPTDFYARFTRDINNLADEAGLGVDGRVISVLEGGYSDRALTSGVLSHLAGMAGPAKPPPAAMSTNGLGHEMGQKLGMTTLEDHASEQETRDDSTTSFDPQWWSLSRLEDLENHINPPPPPPPRKPKGPANPTYTTVTQSFTAKLAPGGRRSLSKSVGSPKKAVSAQIPLPDVEWAVATHELSKLLKPDRQTESCKPEDLNAEATRIRRDRQSLVTGHTQPPPVENGKRMQLRGRKPKAPAEPESRPSSRTSRRKTIGGLDGESDENAKTDARHPRRRVSVASTILSTAEEAPEFSQSSQLTSRPLSSSSILRPASAASSRTNLPADKAPGKPRASSKTRILKKPSTTLQTSLPRGPTAPKLGRPPKSVAATKPADMDSLTSDVKKMSIKLNVPPKPSQAAREVKPKAIRAPRKAPISTKAIKKPTQPATALSSLSGVSETPTGIQVQHHNSSQMPTHGQTFVPPVSQATDQPLQKSPMSPISAPDGTASKVSIGVASTGCVIADPIQNQATLPITLDQRIGHDIQAPQPKPNGVVGIDSANAAHGMPPSFYPPDVATIPAPVTKSELDIPNDVRAPQISEVVANTMPPPFMPDASNLPSLGPGVAEGSSSFVPLPSVQPPAQQATPKRSRQDLPVFTSDSPLVFGPPKHASATMSQSLASETGTQSALGVVAGQSVDSHQSGIEHDSKDIWEVPDTPQRNL